MTISVRRASSDDIDWLLSQLKLFSDFFGTKRALFPSEEHARPGVELMVASHLVLIADHPAIGPVGFIAGYVTPHPYNPSIRLLAESFWWVSEEHRGTRAGLLLLNEFVAWGKANADWVTFALEAKSPVTDRVLLDRGFVQQERTFLLEV